MFLISQYTEQKVDIRGSSIKKERRLEGVGGVRIYIIKERRSTECRNEKFYTVRV